EAEIAQLDEGERAEFLAELGLAEPGLNRVIRAAYRLLGLETFFTAGPKEVRAWTVRRGATAPQAAGVIHTDFERGFIRAEVIAFGDFIAGKGEAGARGAGGTAASCASRARSTSLRRGTSCASASTSEHGSAAVRSPRGPLGATRAELTARLPLARVRAGGARFRFLVAVGAHAAG